MLFVVVVILVLAAAVFAATNQRTGEPMGLGSTALHWIVDAGEKLLAENLVALVEGIANRFFGDKATDGDKRAIARAEMDAMARAAAARLASDVAQKEVNERVSKTMAMIYRIDVNRLFTPDGSIADTGVVVEETVALTSISWAIVQEWAKREGITLEPPTDGERDNLGALGRVFGRVIVSDTSDRRVPNEIQAVIDAGASAFDVSDTTV